MACVYRGEDNNLNRTVAVKVMTAALADSDDFRERFDEEGKIIARFRHPNIVTVFASGSVGDQRYIVQEFVPGGTLEGPVAEGMSPRKAFRVAREIASALAYSHDQNILHRDVKPANILFTEDGAAVLSDFGIARDMDSDDGRTQAGSVVGSLRYMAPEQLRGETATDKVDVYALGLLLFEMLTGDIPPASLRTIRDDSHADELRALLPDGKRTTARIIGRCLHMDPTQRPTASQCVALLLVQQRAEAGAVRRKAMLRWVGLAAVVALIVAGLAGWYVASIPHLTFTPETARVSVNGDAAAAGLRLDQNLPLRVTVVEPGYYGAHLALAEAAPEDVHLTLAPLHNPEFAEFQLFTQLFNKTDDAQALDPEAFDSPTYAALIEIARLRALGDAGQLEERLAAFQALATAGDASAQLVLVLLTDEGWYDLSDASMKSTLSRASQSGYGLASFYLALKKRQDENLNRAGLDDLARKEYIETLQLAVDQGLEFARQFVQQAQG